MWSFVAPALALVIIGFILYTFYDEPITFTKAPVKNNGKQFSRNSSNPNTFTFSFWDDYYKIMRILQIFEDNTYVLVYDDHVVKKGLLKGFDLYTITNIKKSFYNLEDKYCRQGSIKDGSNYQIQYNNRTINLGEMLDGCLPHFLSTDFENLKAMFYLRE